MTFNLTEAGATGLMSQPENWFIIVGLVIVVGFGVFVFFAFWQFFSMR